ncbi:MAG: insulinase family protein [Clostridia bacterium]|nr:insulinase family protein [Clostridia bacterium]
MTKLLTLEGGLRVYYHRHPASRAFALGVFVGAGSFFERGKNNGVAHFIEHMVFKGTEKRSAFDIANEADACGLSINAYTGKQCTAFYTVGLIDYKEKCADLLSDMYYNPTFTEENMAKEKGVVIEEIRMYEDDSEDLCLENLSLAHYGKSPVSAPILGPERNVRRFDRAIIEDFRDRFYRLDNTCVSVIGDLSEEEAVDLVKRYFPQKAYERSYRRPPLRTLTPKAQYIEKIKPFEQSSVAISLPSYPQNDPNVNVPTFVTNILGGGMSSRLFQDVREQAGLVYEIYASHNQYINNAHAYVYFGTAPSQVEEALRRVRACILKAQEGFTQEEFDKTMAQLKTSIALSSDSVSSIMRLGGHQSFLGKTYSPESAIRDLEQVTLSDVNERLRELLDLNKASLSYVGKKPSADLMGVLRGER